MNSCAMIISSFWATTVFRMSDTKYREAALILDTNSKHFILTKGRAEVKRECCYFCIFCDIAGP